MKVVSLELTKSEASEETIESKEVERPLYPYGTCLYLDEVALAKLGIADCEVGDEIKIVAMGKVVGCSEREYEGGKHQTMDIQLTEMGCEDSDEGDEPAETSMGRAAQTLYGKGGA